MCFYVDKGLHPEKIGVWGAVSQKRIAEQKFFKEMVDSEVCCSIISQFIAILQSDEYYCTFQ